jgi:uncharacterized membrane protein
LRPGGAFDGRPVHFELDAAGYHRYTVEPALMGLMMRSSLISIFLTAFGFGALGILIGVLGGYFLFVQGGISEATLKAYGPPIAAIATSVSAIIALIGTLVQNQRTLRLQRTHFIEERDEKRRQFLIDKLHMVAQELATNIASALHSICWLTWIADNNRSALTDRVIKKYNDEMHALLPKILGLEASLGPIDPKKMNVMEGYISRVETLDVKVSQAVLALDSSDPKTYAKLAGYNDEACKLLNELAKQLANLISAQSPSISRAEAGARL